MQTELQLPFAVTSTTDVCKIQGMGLKLDALNAAMNNPFGTELARLRTEKGLNQSELARAVGVTPQAVQKWEGGQSKPRTSKVTEIATALSVSPSKLVALLMGADMDEPSIFDESVRQGTMQVHIADDGDAQVMKIPYYEAKASCGNGVIVFDGGPKGHLLKEETFFRKYDIEPQDIIAVYADGNSNADFIVEGDIALFNRKKNEPRSGKLFLIDHPDGLRIKQMRRLVDGSWMLESRNPDKREYPDEVIQPSQAESLRILGEFFYRQGG